MTTTTDLLRLTQWLSPSFPISGYAYSHGLEAAMESGRVRNANDVFDWVATVLEHGTGAFDAWVIASAMSGVDPQDLADMVTARAGSAERQEETKAQGTAFCQTTNGMGQVAVDDLPLPVAFGIRAKGMEAEAAIALYLHAFAGNLVAAATRFLPLGQTEAQTTLAKLHPLIARIAANVPDTAPGNAALMADLDAMAHETQTARIFRT